MSLAKTIVRHVFPIEAATNGVDSLGGSHLLRPSKTDTTSVSLPTSIDPFNCRSNKILGGSFVAVHAASQRNAMANWAK